MKIGRSPRVVLFLLVLFTVSAILIKAERAVGEEVRGVKDTMVKLGLIADMTGPIATTWMEAVEGFRNYVKYVNAQGGIHGRKLKVIYEDSRYTIPGDIAAYKKLVFKDKILAMLGASSTGGTVALFSQIKKHKLPTLAASQAEPMYNPPKRYVFCTAAGYSEEIKVIFDFIIKDFKVKDPKIGIVYPDVEFGKTNLAQAKRSAKHYGVTLFPEVLNVGALEASSQVLSLKRRKVDFVIVNQLVSGAVALLRETRKMSLKVTFLGTGWTCSEDTLKAAGQSAKNYYGVHAYSSWYDDTPGMAKLREITLKIKPNKNDYTKNYSKGWLSGIIMAEAIKRAGKGLDGESFVTALETFKKFDTGGVTGYITYGPNERMGGEYLRVYKADTEKNKLTPFTDWRKSAH